VLAIEQRTVRSGLRPGDDPSRPFVAMGKRSLSIRIMQAVWETSDQSGSALLLLLALADHATDEGLAWPRIETLAQKTRLGERYVRKLLASLARAGHLTVEPHPADRRRHAYRLGRYRLDDGGTGVPVIAGTPVPPSDPRYRNPGSADSRASGSGTLRNRGTGFFLKEYPSVQPSVNPFPPGWAERVERVQGIWESCDPEVERPAAGRVGLWLRAWDDDEALGAALRTLRRRGAFDLSVAYVHACLATALRNGRRLAPTREERESAELQAPGLREPAPPFDARARLAALAGSLPAALPHRDRWARAVLDLAAGEADLERLEADLGRLDRELLAEAAAAVDGGELAAHAARALGRIGGRLPAAERARVAGAVRRDLLRRRLGLPVLSLFSPEAEGRGGPAPGREVPDDE
jgi:hypothetical protein